MTFLCLSYFGAALTFYITESVIQGYRGKQCDVGGAWIIWPIVAVIVVATVVEHAGSFFYKLGKDAREEDDES